MRLVLVFSGFLAAAVASATSDAPRGTLLSALTGRVDDDAAAPDRDDDEFADVAAPGFEGDAKNVSTVELWYQGAAKHFDDFSFFAHWANPSKWNTTMMVWGTICSTAGPDFMIGLIRLSTADAERVVAAMAPSDPVAASPAPPGPGEVPENLCCPISMEIMEQPVLAADGFTYDRHAIEAWLARGKTTSPTTGAPLAHTMLTPNHLVKSMIAEYQESKG